MRTLLVSDLHLGGQSHVDVLRREPALSRLCEEVARADRLVLLGDLLELRHGPAREALAAARPALEAVGEALPAGAECVVVPGNHDHALATPWLDHLTAPLGLERHVKPSTASPLARQVAKALGPDRTTVAYPGVWVRDDVWATHGHYQDLHGTVPTFERLACGAMQRLAGSLPDGDCTAEDYERVIAPLYAWIHATAQRVEEGRVAAGAGTAVKAYQLLSGDGHKPIKLRALAAAFPLGIKGLNLLGIGPVSADLSAAALRRNALSAMGEAVSRLGVEAEHVIFGHSHRTGPLEGDKPGEWRAPTGALLHNCGNWVFESHFMAGPDGASPYWPGGAILVEDEGPPQLLRLLEDMPGEELRGS